jgi:hypothetical protein
MYSEPTLCYLGGPSIVHDVAQVISQRSVHGGSGRRSTQSTRPASYVTHVYPADCTNIMSIMQTLISGFVKSSIVNGGRGRWRLTVGNSSHSLQNLPDANLQLL